MTPFIHMFLVKQFLEVVLFKVHNSVKNENLRNSQSLVCLQPCAQTHTPMMIVNVTPVSPLYVLLLQVHLVNVQKHFGNLFTVW